MVFLRTLPFLAVAALLGGLSSCSYLKPGAGQARYLESGKKYIAAKEYPRAILQLKNAQRTDPKDAEAYYLLGEVYLATGEPQAAVDQFQRAVALNPKHTRAQVRLAEMTAANKDPGTVAGTAKRVEDILKYSPDNPDALNALAISEARLDHSDQAIAHLEQALKKAPYHVKSAVSLASIRASKGDTQGAESVLTRLATDAPKSVEPQLALAQFYWAAGRKEAVEPALRRALQIDANSGPALTLLGVLQMRTGQIEPAGETYRRLAALPDPQYRNVHALYLIKTGKPEAAAAELAKLARADSSNRALRSLLVTAYARAGKQAEAEKVLSDALAANPKDTEALLQRGEFYLTQGRAPDAERDLRQVLRFKPDSAQAHLVMSRIYQARGMQRNQKQELSEAIRLSERLLPARLEMARLLVLSGGGATALDLLNKAPKDQQQMVPLITVKNLALMAVEDWKGARKGIDAGLKRERTSDLLLQDAVCRLKLEKDVKGARASLESGIESSPEDARLADSLAWSYVSQKQAEAGMARLRELAGRHPGSAALRVVLGKWLARLGSPDEARIALESALKLNPALTEADLAVVDIDQRAGKLAEARARLARLMKARPESAGLRLKLAGLEDQAGNVPAAIEEYRKVLAADPNNLLALNNLAFRLANDSRQPDEALKFAQQAKELAPENPFIDDTLGWAFYQKGLYPNAVQHLEAAVRRQATAQRQYHLAMAYLKSGDTRRGETALRAALEQDPNLAEAKLAREQLKRAADR